MQLAPIVRAKSEYRRFLFTYLFDGREWSIEVPALSAEEARQRVKILPFARCDGELSQREPEDTSAKPRRIGWFTRAA